MSPHLSQAIVCLERALATNVKCTNWAGRGQREISARPLIYLFSHIDGALLKGGNLRRDTHNVFVLKADAYVFDLEIQGLFSRLSFHSCLRVLQRSLVGVVSVHWYNVKFSLSPLYRLTYLVSRAGAGAGAGAGAVDNTCVCFWK